MYIKSGGLTIISSVFVEFLTNPLIPFSKSSDVRINLCILSSPITLLE